MRYHISLLIAITFVGCASLKHIKWLSERPSEKGYYTGIAKISKKNHKNDYQQKALDMALGFLSSEIKVSVKSISENILKDNNGVVDLSFTSETITISNEDLDGYEVVDVKQTRNEYAIYCRLSKSKYLENKRKKFTGQISIIQKTNSEYLKSVKDRNLNRALDLALKLKEESLTLKRNRHFTPYMTSQELMDLESSYNLYDILISNLQMKIENKKGMPFSWYSGKDTFISLTDSSGHPWINWQGTLLYQNRPVHTFEEMREPHAPLPISVFIWNHKSSSFILEIQHNKRRKNNIIKTVSSNIPANVNISKGLIRGKNIPSSCKKNIEDLVSLFVSQSIRSKSQRNESKITVNAEFVKIFSSSKWVSGKLILTFVHDRLRSSKGVGRIRVLCSASTIGKAVNIGIEDIRKTINNNKIKWE